MNEADKWTKDVEGSRREEEAEPIEEGEGGGHQVHDGKSSSSFGRKMKLKQRKVGVALPFLQGVSPAGFLSANRRQPGGSDHVIQVVWPHHLFPLYFQLRDLSCY